MEPAVPSKVSTYFRFHTPHAHLASTFGDDWFGAKAEIFARFFGTPVFLVGQTIAVAIWIALNVAGVTHFDLYPFILLNLAFSLQAAYAAPLILLAQTRQAARDNAHADADAHHREDIAQSGIVMQQAAIKESETMRKLLEQNTRLTETTAELSRRIAELTNEIHSKVVTG